MSLAIFCLFIIVYFDMALLVRRDKQLFSRVFELSPIRLGMILLIIPIILIICEDWWNVLPQVLLLFILPIYLIRRNRFIQSAREQIQKWVLYISNALGVVAIWLYGVIVFNFLVSGYMDIFPEAISQMGDLILSAAFSTILIMYLVYRSSMHFSQKGFLFNLGLRKGNISRWKCVILPIALGIFFAFIASYLTVTRQIQPQTPLSDVIETTKSVNLMLIFLFLAIGIAPFVEEIVFRGYFFHVFEEWIGMKKTIYVVALTFAILHVGQYWGDWMAIVMVTFLGFTLTILRAWTGTTLASIITHFVYNSGVTIIPLLIIAVMNPAYFDYKVNYPHHDAQTKEVLLKKSIAKQPDLVDAYNDLAWLYAQEEINLESALDLIEIALKSAPEQQAYLDTKAVILEKLGRFEEAKSIREKLEAKLP